MTKIDEWKNGILTEKDMTSDQQAKYDAEVKSFEDGSVNRKLNYIKQIRLEKLIETDYYALQDVTMSDAMKTYRQNLRDIPANHTTEEAYDLLLARDEQGNSTHSVWSKP
jgi:hypothetical protein